MKFKSTIVLLTLLSVALNIGLLAQFILTSGSPDVDRQAQVEDAEAAVPSSNEHHARYQKLLAKGLSDHQAKTLILSSLQAQASSDNVATRVYWKPVVGNVRIDGIQSMLNKERTLRTELLEVFGESAKTDPTFVHVFQPLAHRLDFLSSDQQIAVREQRLNAQIKALKRAKSGNYIAARPAVNVADLLPADTAFEYNLRYSTKAAQLRQADVDFSEQLFRDTFRILAATSNVSDKGQQATSAIIQQREELRALLGHDDATKVIAALDSRFASMSKKGRFQGLTQDQLYFVYQIIADSEAQMIRGYHLRQTNQSAGIKMIREASVTRNTKLASYLGEEVASLLIKAFNSNDSREIAPVVQRY